VFGFIVDSNGESIVRLEWKASCEMKNFVLIRGRYFGRNDDDDDDLLDWWQWLHQFKTKSIINH